MQAQIKTTADRRRLVLVSFQRQSPDADSPQIEVVYRLYWPEDFTLKGDPYVLYFLSSTRADTREHVELTDSEITAVMEAAVVRAASECQEW
jgi:predicted peptidase